MRLYFSLFILLLFALNGNAEERTFWYAAYNYDGPFIVSHSLDYFQDQLRKARGKERVFAYVDLGNKFYLNKDFENTIKTFEEAVDFTESSTDTNISNLRYGLYNLLVERSHYTGHYEKSYYYIKKYLAIVPEYRPENAFIRLNRIKIFVKSFYFENYSISQYEIKRLSDDFLKTRAYPAYIEAALMSFSKGVEVFDNKPIEKVINALPSPYKEEGYMNLHYSNIYRYPKYLKMGIGIPDSHYLAYFRLNIGLAQLYIKNNDSFNVISSMQKAYSVVPFLGDVEVERHYAGIYLELIKKFPNIQGVKSMDFFMDEEFYRGRTLASNLVARDLLTEANKKIKEEQDRNNKFIILLIVLLAILIALLLFAISAYSKLKIANTYRQWFSTALSHDLRSPVAEIAQSLNNNNGIEKAKNALINYEYLLDDTLSMALSSQKAKGTQMKSVDIKELILELLLDLDFLIKSKEINVTCDIEENSLVKGDASGLKVMFRNILLNAIKHNKEAGFIKIEQQKNSTFSLIISNSVSDNNKQDQASAGTYIIDYFIKQHKAKYSFEIIDKIAVVGVEF